MKQKSSHMLKFFLGDIKHAEQLPGQMGGQFGGIEGKPKLNMNTVNAFSKLRPGSSEFWAFRAGIWPLSETTSTIGKLELGKKGTKQTRSNP